MTNYSIADLATRLNNSYKAEKCYIEVPHTKDNYDVLTILNKMGIIEITTPSNFYRVTPELMNNKKSTKFIPKKPMLSLKDTHKVICLIIKLYNKNNNYLVEKRKLLSVISKPGKRHYISYKKLQDFNNGYKTYILRTSKGIISAQTAIEYQIGGELLLKVSYV